MDCAMDASGMVPAAMPAGACQPFWFALWQNVGWSARVARIWSHDTAYRQQDSAYLDRVLPTLTVQDRCFVEGVIRRETGVPAGELVF